MSTEAPGSLAAALVQLQAQLPRIGKDSEATVTTKTGGKYTYRYVDLHVITAALFPLLTELGLYWTCLPTMQDGQFGLRYMLSHAPSNDTIGGFYPLPNDTPQTIGGAITYARRYALCAVTGVVADEDDDAQAAENESKARQGEEWQPPAHPHSRKADRHNARRQGPLPDDEWTTEPVAGGTSSKAQRNAIATLAARLGAVDDDDRHELIRQALDFAAPTSSADISATEASQVIKWMQGKVNS